MVEQNKYKHLQIDLQNKGNQQPFLDYWKQHEELGQQCPYPKSLHPWEESVG